MDFIFGEKTEELKKRLAYADIKQNPRSWAAMNFIFSIAITAIITAGVYYLFKELLYAGISAAVTYSLYYLFISTVVSVRADQKAKYVEQNLPDALLLIASNLRSGMPTDEAIILSARPEFGFLADKIKDAGQNIATGKTFGYAFGKIAEDIDSPLLKKTIDLIIEGVESGGEIATLLEETATDIRDNDLLQREVRSIILVYALFIFIAAIVAAPVLYAISTHLAQSLSRFSAAVAVTFLLKNVPTVTIQPSDFPADFLVTFSYINLVITAVFGSLMVALITKGNEKYGLRYIPVFVTLSIVIFLVVRFLVGGFFSNIRI